MKFWCSVASALTVLTLVAATPATATPIFEGQRVEVTWLYPDLLTVFPGGGPVITDPVGPGVELLDFAGAVDIDISDTNIRITLTRPAGMNDVEFDGLRFFDVFNTIPTNLNITVNPATNYAGFDGSRLTADENTLWVNLANLPGLTGQFVSIDFAPQATGVPEPGSMLLLGTGLAGLVLQSKRRRSRPGAAPR